jgi:hypothetical protein
MPVLAGEEKGGSEMTEEQIRRLIFDSQFRLITTLEMLLQNDKCGRTLEEKLAYLRVVFIEGYRKQYGEDPPTAPAGNDPDIWPDLLM